MKVLRTVARMINGYGSILTEKITVGEARKARTKNMSWLWIILLVIGAIGVLGYLVGTVLEEIYESEFWWVDALLFAVIPFALGLIFTLALRIQKKSEIKTDDISTNCELFSDCLIFREFRDGEQLGVFRITYPQILSVKQRGCFLYCIIAQGIAYPLFLGGISEAEINTIRKQLKLRVSENADTVELKQCNLVN